MLLEMYDSHSDRTIRINISIYVYEILKNQVIKKGMRRATLPGRKFFWAKFSNFRRI